MLIVICYLFFFLKNKVVCLQTSDTINTPGMGILAVLGPQPFGERVAISKVLLMAAGKANVTFSASSSSFHGQPSSSFFPFGNRKGRHDRPYYVVQNSLLRHVPCVDV